MAVTESPPAAVATATAPSPSAHAGQPRGLAGVLGSADHLVVGRLYIAFSVLFGMAVAVAGVLVDLERLNTATITVLTKDTYAQVLSFHDHAFPYLLVAPLMLGLAIAIVPTQVGSPAIAFPRAAAASFWAWLMGAALFSASYIMNGGPGGGRAKGVDLFVVSYTLLVVALLLGAICVATTVLALRTPGMSLKRVPLFAWSCLVTAVLWLVSLPVLLASLLLAYVDHTHSSTSYGRNADLAGRLAWAISHPQVVLLVVPLLGFAGDVLATTARARQAARGVAMAAIAAFGMFSYGAYLAGGNPAILRQPLYIGLALLAVVPLMVLLVLWGDLFRRGSFRLNGPLVFAVAAFLALLAGTVAGALNALGGARASLHFGPAADQGITHCILFAGVIGGLGGLHWWATKVLRRPAAAGAGMLAAALMLLGAVVYAGADVISGWTGNAQEKVLGIETLNGVALAGVIAALLGVTIALVSLLPALRAADADADVDPWEGQTLEWADPARPFPVVRTAEPLLDLREETS